MNTLISQKSFGTPRAIARGLTWFALGVCSAALIAPSARAAYHLWSLREVYTDSSGNLQFIELSSPFGGQQFVGGQQMSIANVGGTVTHTFTIPSNLPGDTANHSLLLGTSGIQAAGGPAPDYIIPTGFLLSGGGTISFWGQNSGSYSALTTDGVFSRTWGDGNATNSPQNFAGQTGVVQGAPPAPPVILSLTAQASLVTLAFTCGTTNACVVETSATGASWTTSPTSPVPVGGHYEITDTAIPVTRMYRILDSSSPGLYSVNTAGYIKAGLAASWNLISNPFLGTSSVQDLFTTSPAFSQILKVGTSDFDCIFDYPPEGWLDCNTFARSTLTLTPGEGAFLRTSQAGTQLFAGIIPEGVLTCKLPAGFSLCSSIVPQQGRLQTDLNFPAQENDTIYKFNPSFGAYSVYTFFDGFWDPDEPTIAVGEAFWANLPTARTWTRNFQISGGGFYSVTNRAFSSGAGGLSPSSGTPPSISVQPQSRTNLLGSDLALAVTASGSAPFRYQWLLDGVAVPGAASSSNYTRLNLQGTNAGNYSVIILNASGAVTSSIARVTVQAVSLDGQPVAGSAFVTNSALVEITNAFGNGAVFYTLDGRYPGTGQLYYGPFTLSTSAVLRVIAYSADYSRSAEAAPINITVFHQPAVDTQPQGQTRLVGEVAVFSVSASGPGPLSYQWYFNSTPISGAVSSTLRITNVQPANVGSYGVIVGNSYGTTASDSVLLRVVAPVAITAQPSSTNVLLNAPVTFTVTASGSPPLQYQWRLNGANLAGKTNSTLAIANARLSDGGTYTVVVLNEVGSLISNPAQLVVQVPVLQPGDQFENRVLIVGSGGSVSGSNIFASKQPGEPNHAGKSGGKSVWYKWTPPISGVTTMSTVGSTFDTVLAVYQGDSLVSLLEVAADDDSGGNLTSEVRFNSTNGVEYAIAIDGVGSAGGYLVLSWTNEPAASRVAVILAQPQDVAVQPGNNALFSVTASGSSLVYQWLFNGAPIAGANGSSLTVSNAQLGAVGVYSVRITNGASQVIVSSAANLELVSQVSPPTRDKFADVGSTGSGSGLLALDPGFTSVSFGIPGSRDFVNTLSGSDLTDPALCAIGGSSRWLIFSPSASGLFSIDTIGTASSLPTIIAVFRGSTLADITAEKRIACDVNSAPDGHSLARFQVDGGSAYSALIDGTNGIKGLIHLNYCLGAAPVLVQSSGPPLVTEGTLLTLTSTLSAATPTPTYQWYRNGNALPGATQSTYSLAEAPAGAAGLYSLVVSNCLGISSNVITRLAVEVPLKINSLPLYSAGKLDFHVTGHASHAFMVQGTSNLLNWIPLYTNQTPFSPVNFADPASGVQPRRFYRAMPWGP